VTNIGWNILESGTNDKPALIAHMAKLKSTALVINSASLAQQMIGVAKYVIDRRTHLDGIVDEGYGSIRIWTPAQYVDAYIRASPDPRTIKYVLNEPHAGNLKDTAILCNWLAEVGRLFVSMGYMAVLGNFGPAWESRENIEGRALDTLIRTIAQHPGKLWYGGHAYTWGAFSLGVGHSSWQDVDRENLSVLERENWANKDTLNRRTTWHLARTDWVTVQRALELGLPPIRTFITEFGWAKMSDMPSSFYAHTDAKYGVSAGRNGLNGGESLEFFWKAVFPNWSKTTAMREQTKWAASLYGSNTECLLYFSWGAFPEYGQDYSGNHQFHRALEEDFEIKQAPPPPRRTILPPTAPVYTLNDPRWSHAEISGRLGQGVNVRALPTTKSKIVGKISRGTPTIGKTIDITFSIGGFHWLPVLILVGLTPVIGWCRTDVTTVNK